MSPRVSDASPDAALIDGFLAGDERSFRLLYRRHAARLRSVVLRLLGGGARSVEADDVIQETWLAVCRGLHTFRGNAQFSTWLTTIGIRMARARLSISDGAHSDDAELASIEAYVPSTADEIDVERLLARLPDQQRAVVVLHDLEGFTHEEIGQQLGVAAGTSKATLSRARAALRRYLNGEVTDG